MNFARVLSMVAVLAGTSSALGQTTTVDFDTFPGGTPVADGSLITNEYPGVVFSTEARSPIATSFEALSLPNALHGDGPNAGASDIYMAFSPPVQSVDFVARGVGRRGLTVTAYSVLNTVIDTATVNNPGTGDGRSDPVSLSGAGIARVELVQLNTTQALESYAIDDFSFTRAVVVAVCGNGTEEAGEVCDDGNIVGCDSCAADCSARTTPGCLVGLSCLTDGTRNPLNTCQACDPVASAFGFTNLANGTGCDDGLFCSTGDSCEAGRCVGTARSCADGLACTVDVCDELSDDCDNTITLGCAIDGMCVADGALDPANPCMACNAAADMNAYTPVMDGTACDDGAFCTEVDSCSAGTCVGTLRTCDDMLDCTADSCAEAIGECLNVLDGGCLIDGECVPDETIDEDNACQVCDPEVATTEYSPVEDGTLCSGPSCMDRTVTPASTCMSATCVAADPMECPDGAACENGDVCAGGCTMDAQCLGDDYCSADGVCVPDGELGEDCERANQCGSGFCDVDDGICCDTSCSGLCQGCASGVCTSHAAGTDPEDECGDQMCNGSASCEAPAGTDAGPGMDVGPPADGGTDDVGAVGGSVTGGACAATPGRGGSSLPTFGLGLFGLLLRRRRSSRSKIQ